MAKITYYLGAGSSYYACPILEKQAEMMIALAELELAEQSEAGNFTESYSFIESERNLLPNDNRLKILWHIGYFGRQAQIYNTIDTYARKLELSGTHTELNLLKMSVSVFFDLWENFYEERYSHFYLDKDSEGSYKKIDQRFTSLFSVLLERKGTKLTLNDSFKFITWNYDLQLESTFQSFMKENEVSNLEELNQFHFSFMENEELENDVFHLNGHRGFFNDIVSKTDKVERFEVKLYENYEKYWESINWIYESASMDEADFHEYMKYAWEHNLNSNWFNKISKTLSETEILVIIGYSFPPFNRKIDQFLFSKLNSRKIKKIVYQDPNANERVIKSLFVNPKPFEMKIEIEHENLNQFHIPNEHFITQNPRVITSLKATPL